MSLENRSQHPKELANQESEEESYLDGRERNLCNSGRHDGPVELSEDRKSARKAFLRRVPLKIKILGLAVAVILAVLIFGIVLPLALDDDETQYLADTTLKNAVDIGNLEVVDYTYKGIAEKTSQFLWAENVDYRVKYEAHVRASYDMSAIEFRVNNEDKSVTVLLPDVEISDPVLDETKFSYLPENATADVRDVIALCKEDVANEFSDAGLRDEALESVRETVEALTKPLLDDVWRIEFEEASTKDQAEQEGVQNETE